MKLIGIALIVASSVGASAQVSMPAAQIITSSADQNVLRAGVEVPLLTREDLTTKKKKLRVGQRIQMEVAANVTKNGVTIIPAGSPAVGEITEIRNKGMWGKSGYIGARALSVRVGDRHIRLSGTFDDKGITGTGGVVAAIAFVPIAGFLTTGTSAHIPLGSAVKAFLDEDIAFATPAPIVAASAVEQAPTVQAASPIATSASFAAPAVVNPSVAH